MADVSPDVGEDLAGVGLIPAPVQLFGGNAKLDHEVGRKVPRLDFPAFLAPEPNQGGFFIAHYDAGVRAADEIAAVDALGSDRP
jgi:hypothetical protein